MFEVTEESSGIFGNDYFREFFYYYCYFDIGSGRDLILGLLLEGTVTLPLCCPLGDAF